MGYVEDQLGRGLILSFCGRWVNLYHELGTAKAHGTMVLLTLTRAHLTPLSGRASGFLTLCHLTSDCINKQLPVLKVFVPFLLGSKKEEHLPVQNKVKVMKTAQWEVVREATGCPFPTRWRRDKARNSKKKMFEISVIFVLPCGKTQWGFTTAVLRKSYSFHTFLIYFVTCGGVVSYTNCTDKYYSRRSLW